MHDCIEFPRGGKPAPYQDEILAEIAKRKRVAVRGPHGLGKTSLASWIVLWGVLTAEDCKVPTTASAWRQLSKFLWPEIHKWARRIRWGNLGRAGIGRNELLALSFKPGDNREAFAVASDNADLIEGAHARRIVYVFDEAKSIPASTWDAAEGAFSGAGTDTPDEAFALAVSTPGEPSGRFYEIHSRHAGYEDWWSRHVTLDEAIAAGRISREWADQRRRQWGETSAVYANRVLGEFAASDAETVVIPLAWVEAANARWREWKDAGMSMPEQMTSVGVDVGRGGDQTVLALRYETIITELRRSHKANVMDVVGRVAAALTHGGAAIVDVIGIGAGVVDRLREMGKSVVAFNAGEQTQMRDRSGELGFTNCRSAAWWNMRELLDPANAEPVALPPDDLLTGDLTAPTWKMTSGGKIQVESKEDIRERIGRSTDSADAVIQAYWKRQLTGKLVY